MAQIDLKHATIYLKDYNAVNSLEVKIGEGNLQWTEKVNRIYTKNRGLLNDVRDGEEEPVDVSFDFIWEFLKATSGDPTIEDVLKHRGQASGWTSVDPDTCRPFALNLHVLYTPACGGIQAERMVLEHFRYEQLQHDLKNASVSCQGKCNKTEATVTRE